MARKHTLHALSASLKVPQKRLAFPSNTKQGREATQDRPEIITQQGYMGDFEMETIVWGQMGTKLSYSLYGYSIIERLPMGRKAKTLSDIVI